jgi:uncharacterized membrane protein (UPF0127 family)
MKLKKGTYEIADTPASRSRGLMFRSKPKRILFKFGRPGRYSIHSFFVAFPFDAIYLDGEMRVTEVYLSVPPFVPLLVPKRPASFLLELPEGEGRKLKLGERIII